MTADLRRALEQRRGVVERARAVEGDAYFVEQVILLVGVGEATIDVKFPVEFVEKPLLTGGGGAGDNQRIIPGAHPNWRVGVLRWDIVEHPEAPDSPGYRGCTLLINCEGAREDETTFQSEAYWCAQGRALTNPIVGGL